MSCVVYTKHGEGAEVLFYINDCSVPSVGELSLSLSLDERSYIVGKCASVNQTESVSPSAFSEEDHHHSDTSFSISSSSEIQLLSLVVFVLFFLFFIFGWLLWHNEQAQWLIEEQCAYSTT